MATKVSKNKENLPNFTLDSYKQTNKMAREIKNKLNSNIDPINQKSDKYKEEVITETELLSLSEELGGINFLVSAKNGNGIELMFKILAEKFLNPDFQDTIENRSTFRDRVASVRLEDTFNRKEKCC